MQGKENSACLKCYGSTSDEVTPKHSDTEYFTLMYLIIFYLGLEECQFSPPVCYKNPLRAQQIRQIFFDFSATKNMGSEAAVAHVYMKEIEAIGTGIGQGSLL